MDLRWRRELTTVRLGSVRHVEPWFGDTRTRQAALLLLCSPFETSISLPSSVRQASPAYTVSSVFPDRIATNIIRESEAQRRHDIIHDPPVGGSVGFGPFLGIVLLLMFHVSSFLVQLLLVFAVISLIVHLFAGSRTA
jgi:hypothetical protein